MSTRSIDLTITLKVLLTGATGMVGEGVLFEALKHPDVGSVTVLGRRPCGVQHPKLKEIVHADFFNLVPVDNQLAGFNACFFCLGVSSIGMKEPAYRRMTHDLTMHVAETLARLNPGMTFCYISGTGTDSSEHGRIMWARVKGKTENDLAKLPFKAFYAFRPGFIRPTPGLRNAFTLAKVAGWFYPVLRFVFPAYVCTLNSLGIAMIRSATQGYSKQIVENKDIALLAGPG
jgi:uncharacterized protein YbjT (DUF2867 family)